MKHIGTRFMAKYSIDRINYTDIEAIAKDWQNLWVGKDMTYFQSLDWYRMLLRFIQVPKYIDCAFFTLKRDGKIILIAPLWIITKRINLVNNRRVYFMGRGTYSDYLNFIYDEFDAEACDLLFNYINKLYPHISWCLERIKDKTELYKYILGTSKHKNFFIKEITSAYCEKLELPNTIEEYQLLLSKQMRQNIRTAQNRADRDNINFEINIDDRTTAISEIRKIYDETLSRHRHIINNRITIKGKIYLSLKQLLVDRLLIKDPKYIPFIDDNNSHLLTITDKKSNKLAAFFNYCIDIPHSELLILTAGLNKDFSHYSPGIICLKRFIHETINTGHFKYLDFTRGDEPYKSKLGAKRNLIYNFTLLVEFK